MLRCVPTVTYLAASHELVSARVHVQECAKNIQRTVRSTSNPACPTYAEQTRSKLDVETLVDYAGLGFRLPPPTPSRAPHGVAAFIDAKPLACQVKQTALYSFIGQIKAIS